MYVIVVYDANQKRVAKMLKTLRRYLTWVQNSVFEGEISPAKLRRLESDLQRVLDPETDSVVIYQFSTRLYSERKTLGLVKGDPERIIF